MCIYIYIYMYIYIYIYIWTQTNIYIENIYCFMFFPKCKNMHTVLQLAFFDQNCASEVRSLLIYVLASPPPNYTHMPPTG